MRTIYLPFAHTQIMHTRTLRLLEYDKIRGMVKRHAVSPLGQEYLDRMRPVRDKQIVQHRMHETSEARLLLDARENPPFGGLHDVRNAVVRAEKQSTLAAQELLDIADTAACCRRVQSFLKAANDACPLLKAQGKLIGAFPCIERAVDEAIAPSGEVLDTASPVLASARRKVRALNDAIQRELQRIVSGPHSMDVLQDAIITQRNGRFCVPVRSECRNTFKGIVHDLSASGQTVFMEPLAVVDMGNDLREAEQKEKEEVERVLAQITAIVGSVAQPLLASIDVAGRLDMIFARAAFSRELDATEPELNTEGVIELLEARHPLLGKGAVPINVTLGIDGNSTLLITGPNTGGKTVTLKTVGLLTMMAQSGLHVPALPGSRLALFDEIYADIGDEQSIEQSLSTFSGHMMNIIGILKEADGKSLALFDEIGAGTDPTEGAALAKAVLLELHERGCRVIATTHYGELKIFGQSTDGFRNASVEFDMETLRPTYRLMIGLPGSSNALAISQRLGLPKTIVSRAKALIGEAPQAMEQVLKQAEGVRRALDRERTRAVHLRRDTEKQSEQLQREQQELETKRDVMLSKARQQAQDIVQQARLEANTLLDELKMTVREARSRGGETPDIAQSRKKVRDVLGAVVEQVSALPMPKPQRVTPVTGNPPLREVVAGQNVYVRSLGHAGMALASGHGDEDVEIQVGIMRVRVPVSDLEARGNRSNAVMAPMSAHVAEPVVEKEIHLLGKRAEEASQELEEYLFDALEAGYAQVRIVHGFGTGTLRQVVQKVLRSHPGVRDYRMGESSEGGGGVTIAELQLGA